MTRTRAIQAPRNPELNHLRQLLQFASVADMCRKKGTCKIEATEAASSRRIASWLELWCFLRLNEAGDVNLSMLP